jgi:hypothetical protein
MFAIIWFYIVPIDWALFNDFFDFDFSWWQDLIIWFDNQDDTIFWDLKFWDFIVIMMLITFTYTYFLKPNNQYG